MYHLLRYVPGSSQNVLILAKGEPLTVWVDTCNCYMEIKMISQYIFGDIINCISLMQYKNLDGKVFYVE